MRKLYHCKSEVITTGDKFKNPDTFLMRRASRHAIFIVPFPFTYFPWPIMRSKPVFVVIRQRCLRVFLRAVKFKPSVAAKNLPLSLAGERIFYAKLNRPKPYTGIAYETKMTDPTDDAYKKSQHDEKR
jgi:hypothetical protein